MTTNRQFHAVTRHTASGRFVDGRLELAADPPQSPEWFACGVYTVDGSQILVVDEPTDPEQYDALDKVTVPAWVTAVVGATVLSTDPGQPPLIELEVVRPDSLGEAQAAFAAACASYADAFGDSDPVDCLVRVGDRVLRVAGLAAGSAEWSGTVGPADESELAEMARWRLYRRAGARWGWGGWDQDGFRFSTASPYDVADLALFGIRSLDGLEIAVFQNPLTDEQRAGLAEAPRPPWIDVVAASRLITPSAAQVARIRVDLVRPPDADPTTIAAAVALSFDLEGRFEVVPTDRVVDILGEQIHVAVESDVDQDHQLTWSVRTSPDT